MLTWKFNLCLWIWGPPFSATHILSYWVVIILGRFSKIMVRKALCQRKCSAWKFLLRTAFFSADAPVLQGPSMLPKCSRFLASHLPLFESSLSFLQQHGLLREYINYHDRVIEVSSSSTRTSPLSRDSSTQTHTHTHTLSLDESFCHSRLSLQQQTLYDGPVNDAEEKLELLRSRCLKKANYADWMPVTL